MVSKTGKKGKKGCLHKFIQGKKKGKLCGKNCRGDFCKDHKVAKKEKKAAYYAEQKQKNTDKRIWNIKQKIKEGKYIDPQPYLLKLRKLDDDAQFLLSEMAGVNFIITGVIDDKTQERFAKAREKASNVLTDEYLMKKICHPYPKMTKTKAIVFKAKLLKQ